MKGMGLWWCCKLYTDGKWIAAHLNFIATMGFIPLSPGSHIPRSNLLSYFRTPCESLYSQSWYLSLPSLALIGSNKDWLAQYQDNMRGIWDHGIGSLVSQWDNTVKSPWVLAVASHYLSWMLLWYKTLKPSNTTEPSPPTLNQVQQMRLVVVGGVLHPGNILGLDTNFWHSTLMVIL